MLRRVFSHSAEVQFIGFSPYNSIAVAPTKTEGCNSLTVATSLIDVKNVFLHLRDKFGPLRAHIQVLCLRPYSVTVSSKKSVFLNAMKVFLCNFFAVKAKSFYGQCLVTLLNKRICSECGVFCVSLCISKLSCCLLFSLS